MLIAEIHITHHHDDEVFFFDFFFRNRQWVASMQELLVIISWRFFTKKIIICSIFAWSWQRHTFKRIKNTVESLCKKLFK